MHFSLKPNTLAVIIALSFGAGCNYSMCVCMEGENGVWTETIKEILRTVIDTEPPRNKQLKPEMVSFIMGFGDST